MGCKTMPGEAQSLVTLCWWLCRLETSVQLLLTGTCKHASGQLTCGACLVCRKHRLQIEQIEAQQAQRAQLSQDLAATQQLFSALQAMRSQQSSVMAGRADVLGSQEPLLHHTGQMKGLTAVNPTANYQRPSPDFCIPAERDTSQSTATGQVTAPAQQQPEEASCSGLPPRKPHSMLHCATK